MSKEAFPQLPPEAQGHIENFPPDLHAQTRDQLLSLSHRELHSEDVFGNPSPIAQAELGEQHQPHIDTVADRMDQASQLLNFAHAELGTTGTEGHEVGFEVLARTAKEVALRTAKEAKAKGESETAVQALESLLVIESLDSSGTDAEQSSVETVRKVVAEGLASELVQATHETFGLVAVQEYGVAPLNNVAKSSSPLLKAASSIDFSDDFSAVAPADSRGSLDELSCGDLLALSQAATVEQADASTSKELLTKALQSTETGKVEPAEVAATLTRASEQGLTDELASTLQNLRLRRRSGDGNYRINDMSTSHLDTTVALLAAQGQTELAKALISSSSKEGEHLQMAAEGLPLAADQKEQVVTTLEGLQQEKQAELRQHLLDSGVSEATAEWVLDSTADPDSAAGITPEFWQKLEADPSSLRALLMSADTDLGKTATAISVVESTGLGEQTDSLLRKIIRMDDPAEVQGYLASFKEAQDTLAHRQTEGARGLDVRRAMDSLAEFSDPAAALQAAEKFYGDEYATKLVALQALLKQGYGQELVTFRPEDIDGLVILRNYCESTGIDIVHIREISSSVLGATNPVERAHTVSEALKIASVSAESMNLFYEIASRENSLEIARAVQSFEAQSYGLTADAHRNLLQKILGNQDPEAVSALIAKVNEQLSGQHISLKDLSEKSLTEALWIAEFGDDGEQFEDFCRDWKIERDCTQAYTEYLKPVRESGDIKAAPSERKPKLANLPEVSAQFEKLGVEPALAESLLDSWLSYSALNIRIYNNGNIKPTATGEDIDGTLAEQGERLTKQFEAFSTYVEQFGIEETKAIVDTFGIHNFMRYKPEQLHEQLRSWQSGEVPAQNVVVGARADWNGALGVDFEQVFGGEGLFRFEASDKTELAKAAVAVGNRERAMGRDPETLSSIKNFVIEGHANPEGILLGTKGEHLVAADYVQEPLNGNRANTYRRHLGTDFRVILKACSTAGEVAYGKNIAESISDYHDVRVEGAKVNTEGSIIIEPDGSVVFNWGKVPSTIYE